MIYGGLSTDLIPVVINHLTGTFSSAMDGYYSHVQRINRLCEHCSGVIEGTIPLCIRCVEI